MNPVPIWGEWFGFQWIHSAEMNMEIPEKQKEAYLAARVFPDPSMIADLCDLARDTLARALKAEHQRVCNNFSGFDVTCDCCPNVHSEHSAEELKCHWSNDDWLRAADEQLKK